jgi:hypothetical protein
MYLHRQARGRSPATSAHCQLGRVQSRRPPRGDRFGGQDGAGVDRPAELLRLAGGVRRPRRPCRLLVAGRYRYGIPVAPDARHTPRDTR